MLSCGSSTSQDCVRLSPQDFGQLAESASETVPALAYGCATHLATAWKCHSKPRSHGFFVPPLLGSPPKEVAKRCSRRIVAEPADLFVSNVSACSGRRSPYCEYNARPPVRARYGSHTARQLLPAEVLQRTLSSAGPAGQMYKPDKMHLVSMLQAEAWKERQARSEMACNCGRASPDLTCRSPCKIAV